MYHRYTTRNEGMQPGTAPRLAERVKNIVLLVLLVACIVLAIFGGRAMSQQAETQKTFVQRMQTECNDALDLVGTLSRTAGANSSATLGRIRSHIHAMDTINQLNVGIHGGGYLISNDTFTVLYAIMDEYSNGLITGMQTGEYQTALTNQLTQLQQATAQLH